MPYTDIVKARAIRRAGRACEMCGTPVTFDSAHFVSAHPIFGILFDEDDCCVLCRVCLQDLDAETRAAAEDRAPPGWDDEPAADSGTVRANAAAREEEDGAGETDAAGSADQAGADLPRAAREAWFPGRGPDDDICA